MCRILKSAASKDNIVNGILVYQSYDDWFELRADCGLIFCQWRSLIWPRWLQRCQAIRPLSPSLANAVWIEILPTLALHLFACMAYFLVQSALDNPLEALPIIGNRPSGQVTFQRNLGKNLYILWITSSAGY